MNMMSQENMRDRKEHKKNKTLAYIGESYYLRSPVLQSFTDRASQITVAALTSIVQ